MGSGFGKAKKEIHGGCVLNVSVKSMFRHVTEFPIFGTIARTAGAGWIKNDIHTGLDNYHSIGADLARAKSMR